MIFANLASSRFNCVIASVLLSLVLFSGTGESRGLKVKKSVDGLEVDVYVDKNPPVAIGDNHIEVEIRDKSGKVVSDAEVLVNYYMPPMPRMPPMNYRINAKLEDGKYRATMKFIMAGPWIIAVKISRGGKRHTAKISVDAQ
jgi:hypothetical protein